MAELFDALCHKLVRRIIAAADKTQNDWADVELSLVRIIARKDELEAGLDHIKAWASQTGLTSLTQKQIIDAVIRMCDDALGGE